MEFRRWYSTSTSDTYTTTLGHGWTHSLDTRLVFPDDPGGRPGVVLLKAHSGNLYEFTDNGDGTYSAYPGVCGILSRQDGPPVTYRFTDNAQWSYTFDDEEKLPGWRTPRVKPGSIPIPTGS